AGRLPDPLPEDRHVRGARGHRDLALSHRRQRRADQAAGQARRARGQPGGLPADLPRRRPSRRRSDLAPRGLVPDPGGRADLSGDARDSRAGAGSAAGALPRASGAAGCGGAVERGGRRDPRGVGLLDQVTAAPGADGPAGDPDATPGPRARPTVAPPLSSRPWPARRRWPLPRWQASSRSPPPWPPATLIACACAPSSGADTRAREILRPSRRHEKAGLAIL